MFLLILFQPMGSWFRAKIKTWDMREQGRCPWGSTVGGAKGGSEERAQGGGGGVSPEASEAEPDTRDPLHPSSVFHGRKEKNKGSTGEGCFWQQCADCAIPACSMDPWPKSDLFKNMVTSCFYSQGITFLFLSESRRKKETTHLHFQGCGMLTGEGRWRSARNWCLQAWDKTIW